MINNRFFTHAKSCARYLSSNSKHEINLPINKFTERTHTCGQLTREDIGKHVRLCGWVQYTRFDNKIIALRDSYGVTQCIINKEQLAGSFKKTSINNESVLQIHGRVHHRPEKQQNSNLSTGEIEVIADQVILLNQAKKDVPILTRDSSNLQTSTNRLAHRYLDIRSQSMQHALRFRSQVCHILRNKLHSLKFVECETPTLFNRTPGGANEFIVPTQQPDKFYSLVQSPQQLKQLLMVGAIDRYFQICKCYRDEAGRSDRQPEFTQVDIELSFTSPDLIMKLVNVLMLDLLTQICTSNRLTQSLTSSFDEDGQICRMSFKDAFENYGTDKPDTRFGWQIRPIEGEGLYIDVPHLLEDSMLTKILDEAKLSSNQTEKTEVQCRSHKAEEKMTIMVSDSSEAARNLLGIIRVAIASELDRREVDVYDSSFKFLWVTDFPLFTADETGQLKSTHHPFTAPTPDTIQLLKTDPLRVVGQHYDLVLNGQEIAGGSLRIHDAQLQRQIFSDVLKVEEKTFDYFLEALHSGCPPHGGIAIGLDRLIAIMLNRESIRDVIAFPKSSTGRDLMTNCPHEISSDVKRLYHLK